jgi:hypothetical protein
MSKERVGDHFHSFFFSQNNNRKGKKIMKTLNGTSMKGRQNRKGKLVDKTQDSLPSTEFWRKGATQKTIL